MKGLTPEELQYLNLILIDSVFFSISVLHPWWQSSSFSMDAIT